MYREELRDTSLRAAFACVVQLQADERTRNRIMSGGELVTTFQGIANTVYDANARYANEMDPSPYVHCGCEYHGDREGCDVTCSTQCTCRFVVIRVN